MENPQSLATEILQLKNLKAISESACTAFCVLWWLDIDCSDVDAIKIIDDAIINGAIEKDCTVTWVKFIKWLTGRNCDVIFTDISTIKRIKEKSIVKFTYNDNSHWVGVENGKVVFDPLGLGHSVCVAKGKPVTMRTIKILKEV